MTEETKEVYEFMWNDIEITITLRPNHIPTYYKFYGYHIAHIGVSASQPLPFSDTGYRSIYIPMPELEKERGAINYVKKLLDQASLSKEWRDYVERSKQGNLF